jgi:hypothetical protein
MFSSCHPALFTGERQRAVAPRYPCYTTRFHSAFRKKIGKRLDYAIIPQTKSSGLTGTIQATASGFADSVNILSSIVLAASIKVVPTGMEGVLVPRVGVQGEACCQQ